MTSDSRVQSAQAVLLDELGEALDRRPREIPPRYFYDEVGSRLFERITALPEYYLTRTERALLRDAGAAWVRHLAPRSLIELGAGSAEKTRILLDALTRVTPDALYLPIDVSAAFLEETGRRLRRSYASLRVQPIVADLTKPLPVPPDLERPALFAFLGSTLGNFDGDAASRLLAGVRSHMRAPDRLLLGADLKKDPARLDAAYNDRQGVTAEFNRNMLRVVNRTFGADFDPLAFDHRARYDAGAGRVEMHLVSRHAQVIHIPGLAPLRLDEGEAIRTEISTKYDRPGLERLLAEAQLDVVEWATDTESLYALLLAVPSTR